MPPTALQLLTRFGSRGGAAAPPKWRYVRLSITSSESDWVDVASLLLFGPTITAGVPTGGTATASSTYGGDYPANAFDGNAATYWESDALPEWLQYAFATDTELTGYGIQARNHASGTARAAPTDWTLEGSLDGSSWTTLDTQSGVSGWTANQTRTYDL